MINWRVEMKTMVFLAILVFIAPAFAEEKRSGPDGATGTSVTMESDKALEDKPEEKLDEKPEEKPKATVCVQSRDQFRVLSSPATEPFPTGEKLTAVAASSDGGPDWELIWPPVLPTQADPHYQFLYMRRAPFKYLALECAK